MQVKGDYWVIVSRAVDNEAHAEVYDYLKDKGIEPAEFLVTDSIRSFLISNGLDYTKPIVFHNGHHVGDVKDFFEAVHMFQQQKDNDQLDHPPTETPAAN